MTNEFSNTANRSSLNLKNFRLFVFILFIICLVNKLRANQSIESNPTGTIGIFKKNKLMGNH